jgi:hypothetical protein
MFKYGLKVNLTSNVTKTSIVDIRKGIIFVTACSNMCDYGQPIKDLLNKYSLYDSDMIMKSANANFATVHGTILITRVNSGLFIATSFSEYLNSFKQKQISFDAFNKGLDFVASIEGILPKDTVYIPMKLGYAMDNKIWQICLLFIHTYLKEVVLINGY